MSSRLTVRGVVFSAIFAAISVVLSFLQVNLGFSPVPITLGNMGIMLTGAFLGARYGFFSSFLLVFLGALGLPLFDGQGGLSVMLGPSGGYVWMYPFDALFVGYFVSRIKGNNWASFLKIFLSIEVFGSLLCYVTGVPWLAHVLHVSFSKALLLGFYPYLPGDAVKALVTTLIILPIRQVYPSWKLTGTSNVTVAKLDHDSFL
ncbi:biotin transporter BioY [Sulfoacidibacillus thermotolerans]|uniref:Biotin transporter n=1 Tax=Sulfoacidibacillus thermotolerans TaxID=1765684 RepID=A0A2U3D832_SULT2|nr:biotin transporter BioY [Sulfoacidibacillus thermotolerans]PWI57446.1 biotin transporter BioY [Sulfoacidibacillus thermotolerans]